MTLGEAIRRYRMAAGLTQADMAQRLDSTSSYLSQIETGDRAPSRDYVQRILAIGRELRVPDLYEQWVTRAFVEPANG